MNQQMDKQLPEGWETTQLAEVADIILGQSPDGKTVNSEGKGIVFYQGKAEFGLLHPTPRNYCTNPKKIAKENDILLSVRAPVGPTNLANQETAIGRGLAAIRETQITNFKFILFYFRNIEQWLSQQGTGTTFQAISGQFIRDLPFPLPPLAEQHYLADKLDSLLTRIQTLSDQLAAVPALLKQFRQSVLADAVSGKLTAEWRNKNELSISNYQEISQQEKQDKLDKRKIKTASLPHEFAPSITLPESWRWLSLDEACYKITDGTHHSPKSYATGDFMYVTSKNVREGYLDLSNITYVDKATHQEIFSRCNVAYQDVLYIKDGVNTGLSCVNTIEEEISLLSSVAVFKPCSFLHPFYLQHYLNSPVGRQVMLDLMGGTAIKRLTLQKIINSPIPIPPLTEQTEIVRRVEALFALADNIEQQSRAAAERVALLTQSVLAKAFRGELSEQWRREHPDLISGDNSAAALLARIQAERAATGKKSRRA